MLTTKNRNLISRGNFPDKINGIVPALSRFASRLVFCMKNILKFSLVSLCASGAVLSAQAGHHEDKKSASNIESDRQLVITEPAGADASARMSMGSSVTRTSNLIGERCFDSSGKHLGTVRDALIDLNSGRLAFLVIDSRGRQIAVPGDSCRTQGDRVVLNVDRSRLASAPAFNYSNLNDQNWINQTYSYWGQSSQGGQVGMNSQNWQSSDTTAYQSSTPTYQSGSSWQGGNNTYQSGSYQQRGFSEAAGGPPARMVTGREQDCQADCILHRYQAGKGSARATDEHYYNNVPGDRLYAQYPAEGGGASFNNYASSTSFQSQPSSGSWYSVSPSASASSSSFSSGSSSGQSSGIISESAGASSGMHLYRSTDLVGMHIRAGNGQDLGEIRDVVLDMNSGRVAYAVVVPTSADFNGKYLAIPPAAFTHSGTDQHVLTVNMDANQLRNAPSFQPNNWPQPQNQTFVTEVYNFYHVSPYWQGSGQRNWNQNDSHRMHHQHDSSSDTFHGSQDLNNQGSNNQGYQGSSSQSYHGSSTSGTYQSGSSTDQQNLNQGAQGSIQNQGTSTDQNQLNSQEQNQNQNQQPVSEPSGSDVKGAEHHDSTLNLKESQSAQPSASSSSSSDQSSSSSSASGLQSSGEVKKGAEHQTDAIRESAGADQSSASKSADQSSQSSSDQSAATQSSTSGTQSSTELKSSQSQPGSATQEAAGAATTPSTSSSDNSSSSTSGTQPETQSSSTSTSPDQSSTSAQSSSTTSSPDQNSTTTQSSSSSSTSGQGSSEKVRSTLKSDATLSPISSNVTIQDQNGKVALNGTVKSEAEKQQIVSKAEELAGSGNVIDNLQVKSDDNNNSNQ